MLHRFQSRGLGAAAAPQSTAPPRSEFEPIEDIRPSFIDKFQRRRIEAGEKPAALRRSLNGQPIDEPDHPR